jgi:hypothetical protein
VRCCLKKEAKTKKDFLYLKNFPVRTGYTNLNMFPIWLHSIGWRELIHSPMGNIKEKVEGLSGLPNVFSGDQIPDLQMRTFCLL